MSGILYPMLDTLATTREPPRRREGTHADTVANLEPNLLVRHDARQIPGDERDADARVLRRALLHGDALRSARLRRDSIRGNARDGPAARHDQDLIIISDSSHIHQHVALLLELDRLDAHRRPAARAHRLDLCANQPVTR